MPKIYWNAYHMFGEQQMMHWHRTIPGMPPYRGIPSGPPHGITSGGAVSTAHISSTTAIFICFTCICHETSHYKILLYIYII